MKEHEPKKIPDAWETNDQRIWHMVQKKDHTISKDLKSVQPHMQM